MFKVIKGSFRSHKSKDAYEMLQKPQKCPLFLLPHFLLFYDIVFTTSCEVSLNKFSPANCIEVPVQSQESERSCMCMLGVSIWRLFTIVLLDFGTLYFVFHFITICQTFNSFILMSEYNL